MSYTTTKRVWEYINAYTEVRDENLGMGDNSKTEFNFEHNNVISGSETIYSAGTALTSGTTMDYDEGHVTFAVAPTTNTQLKIDYDYAELPDSVVLSMISQSDKYIDINTRRTFDLNTGEVEYLDVDPKQKIFFLKNYPVITCSEVAENTAGQTSAPSWVTRSEGLGEDYICNSYDKELGRIRFIDNFPQQGIDIIRVTYDYGYTTATYHPLARELSILLTIRRLVDSNLYRTIVQGKDAFSPIRLEQIDERINTLFNQIKKTEFTMV